MSYGGKYCSCDPIRGPGCPDCQLPNGGYTRDGDGGSRLSYTPSHRKVWCKRCNRKLFDGYYGGSWRCEKSGYIDRSDVDVGFFWDSCKVHHCTATKLPAIKVFRCHGDYLCEYCVPSNRKCPLKKCKNKVTEDTGQWVDCGKG